MCHYRPVTCVNHKEICLPLSRRAFLVASLASLSPRAWPVGAKTPFLFGTTPVILDEQAAFLDRLRIYLETRLRRPVSIVQRGSYRDIVGLLTSNKLDAAWLCGYPYVRMKDRLRLVAVPVYAGQPTYHSYLIVTAEDKSTRSIADLRGKVFAYSDPDSNSGWLTPQVELKRLGEDPMRFFRKTLFTWSHRKVIEAVAAGLAHGGAVDGYIWDSLARIHPELTGATRVAWRSEAFGFPPIVARKDMASETHATLTRALLGMSITPPGRNLLEALNLEGFIPGSPTLFDSVEANWNLVKS